MENIIDKLNQIKRNKETDSILDNWSSEEIKQLLNLYLIISKKEHHIFDIIYNYHDCDSWEDIFRDYDIDYLQDKSRGVQIAIEQIEKQIAIEQIEKQTVIEQIEIEQTAIEQIAIEQIAIEQIAIEQIAENKN